MERERKRLDSVAQERGFENAAAMLHDMYVVQHIPIQKIADTLFTPIWTLRKRFDDVGITVKGRGGRNNVKYEITEELYQEVLRDGIEIVCSRLGVESVPFRQRLQKWYLQREERRRVEQSEQGSNVGEGNDTV